LCHFRSATRLIIGFPLLVQIKQVLAQLAASLDFTPRDQTKPENLAQFLACAMPTQAIATSAGRQTITGRFGTAFATLNDVIHFPISDSITPPSLVQVYRVATKMAMTIRFLPYTPQLI
jgi:hypothetical protein